MGEHQNTHSRTILLSLSAKRGGAESGSSTVDPMVELMVVHGIPFTLCYVDKLTSTASWGSHKEGWLERDKSLEELTPQLMLELSDWTHFRPQRQVPAQYATISIPSMAEVQHSHEGWRVLQSIEWLQEGGVPFAIKRIEPGERPTISWADRSEELDRVPEFLDDIQAWLSA